MTTTAPIAHLSRRGRALRSSQIRDLLRLASAPGVISLAGGLPDAAGFPTAAIAEAAARAARSRPGTSLQYGPTEGDDDLRRILAARHREATDRSTSVDQVLVTTGSQQALDLLGRVLGDPGDRVAVDDPGYLGALQAFRAAGLDPIGIPVDDDGLVVERLEVLLRTERPRFAYTVPTFHNPTGHTLGAERRRRLAALADEHDLLVIADEPYADLRFAGTPPAPLAAHSHRVVSVGTTSKLIAPGLRVGWIIGPPWLIAAATRAKQAVDLHTSSLTQAVVVELLGHPDALADHLDALTRVSRQRASTLREALVARLGDDLGVLRHCSDPDGGMFLWLELEQIDTTALLPVAIAHGTAFVPGSAFAVTDPDGLRTSLRVSFASTDTDGLVAAVDRLATAVTTMYRA